MRHDDASEAPSSAGSKPQDTGSKGSGKPGAGDKAARKAADRQGQRFGQSGVEKKG